MIPAMRVMGRNQMDQAPACPLVSCAQRETPKIKTAKDRVIAARGVQGEQERRLQLRSAIQCPPAEIELSYRCGSQRQKVQKLRTRSGNDAGKAYRRRGQHRHKRLRTAYRATSAPYVPLSPNDPL